MIEHGWTWAEECATDTMRLVTGLEFFPYWKKANGSPCCRSDITVTANIVVKCAFDYSFLATQNTGRYVF